MKEKIITTLPVKQMFKHISSLNKEARDATYSNSYLLPMGTGIRFSNGTVHYSRIIKITDDVFILNQPIIQNVPQKPFKFRLQPRKRTWAKTINLILTPDTKLTLVEVTEI